MSVWRPRAYAPRDGHPFLAHVPTVSDPDFNPTGVVEAYYAEDEGFIGAMWNPEQDCWEPRPISFKHWMPKPAAPTTDTEAE